MTLEDEIPPSSLVAVAKSTASVEPVNVVLATPLGANGRGGMDRLTDLVIDEIGRNAELSSITVTRLTTKGGRGKLWAIPVFAAALAKFTTLALRGRANVLHLNLAADGSFTRKAMLATIARRFSIPYVVHIHTGRFEPFWSGASPARRARIDRLMRNSARIIVLGQVFRDMVATHVPDAAGKIAILPNASPARPRAARSAAGEPVRITYLGVLAPAKGVPQLIEALGRIGTRLPWIATLAGYGDLEQTRARAAGLGILERINTPGWVSPSGVDALLAETDILVLPSLSEGLPMSIIEAFAAGIPVIATSVGATPDVVKDNINGLLVPPADADALAVALTRLLESPAERETMGDAAAEAHSRRFRAAPYVETLIQIWRTAARG